MLAQKKVKKSKVFNIDCTKPVDDGVMEVANLVEYLNNRIKVDGKPGALGDKVSVSADKSNKKVMVRSKQAMSKRYLKYLTKKFLKKKELREYLRIVSTSPSTYEIRYPKVAGDDESADA